MKDCSPLALTPSEALFGFVGWLTSREESVTLSSHHLCSGIPELVGRFSSENDLAAPRDGWHRLLRHPKDPTPERAPMGGEEVRGRADEVKSAGASQAECHVGRGAPEFTHEELASAAAAANAFIGLDLGKLGDDRSVLYWLGEPVDLSRYGRNLQFHPLSQARTEALFAFAMDLARTPPAAPPITATEIGLRDTIRTLVCERDASERTVLHLRAHVDNLEKVLAEFKTQVQQVTNERNVWKDIANQRGQRMLEAARALQRTAQDGDKG